MNYMWLAIKDLTLFGRDKKALLTLIMMPILLIAILGAAFSNVFKEEGADPIKKFSLGIVNNDQGPLGKMLIKEGFKKVSREMDVKLYKEKGMLDKIKNNQLPIGIVIESDFSASIMAGEKAKIRLITAANPRMRAMIVQNVIEQFTQFITIETAASKLVQPGQMNPPQNNIGAAGQSSQPVLHETTINSKTHLVSSFQYYSAAMGVMFLLMTVVQGVSTMILEKEQEVYKRLLVTNLTYGQYLTGKLLGLIVICLVQAFIMIFGTKLLFGVNWGTSFSGVALVTFSYVISACGLGILAGSIFKTEKSFGVAGMLGSQILAALGGSMAPLYIFPGFIVLMTKIFPNGLALQTYLELMSGASFTQIIPASGGLLGLGGLFFGMGMLRLSFARRREYA